MPTARWGHETISAATDDTVKDTLEDMIEGWCADRLAEGSAEPLNEVTIGDEVYRIELKATLVPR